MYSGSDSTESPNNPQQWALMNPSSFQNISSDQVDWAALAQQWIIMKEAGPPPASLEQKYNKSILKAGLEGGEAPMDMENDKDDVPWSGPTDPKLRSDWNWSGQPNWSYWNQSCVSPPLIGKPPLLPTPVGFSQYTTAPDAASDNSFNNFSSGPPNGEPGSGYWTAAGSSKQLKPHNRRFSKVNVPRTASVPLVELPPVVQIAPPTLDAAKRKQLPAWIREGLEKMEKEKLKQMERDKEQQEREEYKVKLKQNEKETMEILKTTIKEKDRSTLESGEEESEEDAIEEEVQQPDTNFLSAAERIMHVRRTMTEILLKVTNREIELICREELHHKQQKHKASDHRVSAPSGANVTSKLGLGMYGDGSESSDSEESNGSPPERNSDTDLKESIKKKKADFHKTEREIEEKLAQVESRRHEQKNRSTSPKPIANESQVDAKHQGRPKRTPKATPPRRAPSSSGSSSSTSGGRRRSRRRSSTSSGGRRAKRPGKRRRRSRSRGRTPERARSRRNGSRSRSARRSHSRRRRSRSRGRKSRSRDDRRRGRRSRSSSRGKRSRRR